MSTHIEAGEGDIADAVLLPGDPLRAQHIAERFLENVRCYNRVRGMFGFTGTYRGVPVSVQGTGMGQPSLSIYATELFRFYGVQKAIRVGTCGALRADGKLREVVIASGACSDSALLSQRFGRLHFAPVADFALLNAARLAAEREGVPCRVGLVASSDLFYDDNENWRFWAKARVTINSADDIVFETLSLSPPDEAPSGTLSAAVLKETKGAYRRIKSYVAEENLPAGMFFEALCKICQDEHHGSIRETEAAIFEMFHSINVRVGAKENMLGLFLRRLKSDMVWKLRMRLHSGE
jgi:purine-nucleoside phosphorylase